MTLPIGKCIVDIDKLLKCSLNPAMTLMRDWTYTREYVYGVDGLVAGLPCVRVELFDCGLYDGTRGGLTCSTHCSQRDPN